MAGPEYFGFFYYCGVLAFLYAWSVAVLDIVLITNILYTPAACLVFISFVVACIPIDCMCDSNLVFSCNRITYMYLLATPGTSCNPITNL